MCFQYRSFKYSDKKVIVIEVCLVSLVPDSSTSRPTPTSRGT